MFSTLRSIFDIKELWSHSDLFKLKKPDTEFFGTFYGGADCRKCKGGPV